MKAVLDAGALVAVDRRNRLIGAQLRVLQQQGTPIRVSSAVVGQVWRDGRTQANLARVLAGVGIEALGKDDGKRIGELLALSGSADIVDAHVALITDARRPRLDQRSRRHPQATASSQGFGAGPDRVRLLDPANLRFQRRVARPGISTAGSSARQIPDQGVGHVLLEQDAAAVPPENTVRWVTCGSSGRQAVCVYSLIRLCFPKTSSGSCDQAIFVDQATDASVSSDAVLFKIDRFGYRFQ